MELFKGSSLQGSPGWPTGVKGGMEGGWGERGINECGKEGTVGTNRLTDGKGEVKVIDFCRGAGKRGRGWKESMRRQTASKSDIISIAPS